VAKALGGVDPLASFGGTSEGEEGEMRVWKESRGLWLVVTVALVFAAAAGAKVGRMYAVKVGDSVAIAVSTCKAVRLRGGVGWRCNTGGDYRGKWGVTINASRITVIRYTGFNRYVTVLAKT